MNERTKAVRERFARVSRGGCWDYVVLYARLAYRLSGKPGNRIDLFGFRLSRVIPVLQRLAENENLDDQ